MEWAFDDWVAAIFDHEAADSTTATRWYWDPAAEHAEPPATEAIAHMTRLFSDPSPLARYSNAQLNIGLWYLIDSGASSNVLALLDDTVPEHERVGCMESVGNLYPALFAERCEDHLSHLDRTGSGGNPLNMVCYMWWDVIPLYPGNAGPLVRPALRVMDQALAIDSIACRESALHGLGHWHQYEPAAVEASIDRLLQSGTPLPADLRAYAESARSGCVN